MQKVERKKRRERKRARPVRLILCALVLAACVTAGILLQRKAEEPPQESRQRVSGAISQRDPEELLGLTVTRRGKEPWSAVRGEDGRLWLLQEESAETDAWMVDETIGSMIIDAAVNLTYEDVFTDRPEEWKPEAAVFGLEDPLVTAVFRYTDGTEITARIGNSADRDENAYYYMAVDGDDRLFAVSSGTVQDLTTEKELLHPVEQLQVFASLLDRVTVKDGNGKVLKEWKLQGNIADRDAAENWLLTAPFVYPADYDAMQNLRDSAENLRLGIYIGEADEETLKRCGLDEPRAVIELHMAAGSTGTVSELGVFDVAEWEERTEVLTLGGKKTEMTLYVLHGNEVFTISEFSLSAFMDTQPLSTIARYPVATPLNSLESVTVERAGKETVHYALVRTRDEDAGDSAETEDSGYRCLRNGEEISYDTFAAAYERLLTVTVSGRLPASFTPGETSEKYTFRTVSGGTHTVELRNYDGIHDAVYMDGHAVFYLIRGGMTELP